MKWVWKNLRAWTQAFGAFINFTVNENENTSSAAYRKRDKHPWVRHLINSVFFKQEDHCRDSVITDIKGSLEFLRAYGIVFPKEVVFEGTVISLDPLSEGQE